MLYLVSPSTQMLRDKIKAGRFGAITTPATRYRVAGLPAWAADNACGPNPYFTAFAVSYPGDDKWLTWLERLTTWRARCLFAVIPDTVCNADATLSQFDRLSGPVADMGYPVALAAQNGMTVDDVPWDRISCLFLGGDDAWKMGPPAVTLIRAALARGKKVHAGRVNGGDRFAYFRALGVHTADGGCINKAPDENVGRIDHWESILPQEVLF